MLRFRSAKRAIRRVCTPGRDAGADRLYGHDPYEPPLAPELVLDAVGCGSAANAGRILQCLKGMNWSLKGALLFRREFQEVRA